MISQVLFVSPIAGKSDAVEFHDSDMMTQIEIDNMLAQCIGVSCLLPQYCPVLPGDEQPSVVCSVPDGIGESGVLYAALYPMQSLSLVAA